MLGFIWAPVQITYVSFLIKFPTNMPGKVAEGGTCTWASITHMETPDGVIVSWLQPALFTATTATCGVNFWMEGVCFSVSRAMPFT